MPFLCKQKKDNFEKGKPEGNSHSSFMGTFGRDEFQETYIYMYVCKYHICNLCSCSVMPDFLHPPGLQPTGFLCLWDFPGKNTQVGCHFILQGIFPTQPRDRTSVSIGRQILYHQCHLGSPTRLNQSSGLCVLCRLFVTLWSVACLAPLSMGFLVKNTGVGCCFLIQGIFLTQGSNLCLLCLLHYRQILCLLSYQGSPLIHK